MKSFCVAIFVLLVVSTTARAQFVTIPDANFVTWLQTNYPSCMSGNQMDTTCSMIVNAPFVSISFNSFTTLSGIEYFSSAVSLNLQDVNILSLPALPPGITQLYAVRCSLTSLPPLPSGLQTLTVDQNQLASLPTLPSTLTDLVCNGNPLTSLPALPASLTHLEAQQCNLASFPPFPNGLVSLLIGGNLMGTCPPLPPNLQTLGIQGSGISALPALPMTVNYLDCSINQLTALPAPLPDSLENLFCTNNLLTALPPLPSKLHRIDCNNNGLTALPALPSTLRILNAFSNQLTTLPALPAGLESIQVYSNQLVTVNNLPASLNTADFRWNQITCFGPFPQSTTLNVSFDGNPLTCIPNYAAFMTPQIGSVPICAPGNPMGCATGEGIGGTVFDDTNSDCILNGVDPGIHHVPVNIYDNSGTFVQGGNSQFGGAYFYTLPLGTWKAKIDTAGKPYRVTCPQPGLDSTVVLSLGTEIVLGVDFEVDCRPGFEIGALAVGVNNIIFPGQPFGAQVLAGDVSQFYGLHCASGVSGQVVVTVAGPVTYTGALPGALVPSVAGNTFTYTITDFGLVNSASDFGLGFLTDTTANANDTVCFDVTVTPTSGDIFPSNNQYSVCYTATNSLDPNEKQVAPTAVAPGYGGWLNYTVHFQNVGTAPAFNIRVEDTLDANLDWASVEMLAASHYHTWTLTGNALKMHFPNIQLPDSASNPSGSQGWFMYRVKPKPNLPFGTVIHNEAAIYFDFNAPIVTNDATTRYNLAVAVNDVANVVERIAVYPNPSKGVFNVDCPATWKRVEWTVTNLMGQEVLRGDEANGHFAVNLGGAPAGFYLLKVMDGKQQEVQRILIQ